jgi:hypothetical protein
LTEESRGAADRSEFGAWALDDVDLLVDNRVVVSLKVSVGKGGDATGGLSCSDALSESWGDRSRKSFRRTFTSFNLTPE